MKTLIPCPPKPTALFPHNVFDGAAYTAAAKKAYAANGAAWAAFNKKFWAIKTGAAPCDFTHGYAHDGAGWAMDHHCVCADAPVPYGTTHFIWKDAA